MGFLIKTFGVILSILLGSLFLYSGYSKLDPVIETFEFTFVDLGIANWYSAPIIARLVIALELFTGLLLIVCYNYRLTVKLTIALLVFFILYLCGQLIVNGNNANCGCFGERHYMSPKLAILKNMVMLGMALAMHFTGSGWKLKKFNSLFAIGVALLSLTLPFIINPVDYSYTSNNMREKIGYPLELDLLYHPQDTAQVEVPSVDMRRGKHVLAFLSLSCPHCRIAAKKMRLIKKENPATPFYFILNGEESNLKGFLDDTKATNIPYSFCLGKSFVQLASAHLPRIYYLDNGIVVKKVDYFELNQYHIENWMKTGKAE